MQARSVLGLLVPTLLAALTIAGPALAQIRINEIQSDNESTVMDPQGDFDDWIEIHNAGPTAVDLSGWALSDDPATPLEWIFTTSAVVPAGGYLIVWADEDEGDGPLHAGFKLNNAGEVVVLSDDTGTLVDTSPAVPLGDDESLGRVPDSTGSWLVLDTPTPGAANQGPGILPSPIPPDFSIPSGFYTSDLTLQITHPDPTVEIRYTMDGSDPTAASPLYTGPLDVQSRAGEPNNLSLIWTGDPRWRAPGGEVYKTPVVRAAAFLPGALPSEIVTRSYFIGPDLPTRYSGTHVLSLVADEDIFFDYDTGIYVPGRIYDEQFDPETGNPFFAPGNFSQQGIEWERPVHVELFGPFGGLELSQQAGVRIHGGATRLFPQKSLRLYARDEYGEDEFDYEFFGEDGPDGLDTIIVRNGGQGFYTWRFRDIFYHNLVEGAPVDTQPYTTTIVFFNGIYWGMQHFRERLDAEYVERHYDVDEDDVVILTRDRILDHGNPGDEQHWDDMVAFMEGNDLSVPANIAWVEQQLDRDSLLHFIAIHVVSGKSDWVPSTSNELHWRKRTAGYVPGADPGHDGRWRWMLKDMDRGLSTGLNRNNFEHNLQNWVPYTSLIVNTGFRDELVNLIADYMNDELHPQVMLAEVNRLTAEMDPYLDEHLERWRWPINRAQWDDIVEDQQDAALQRPDIVRGHVITEFSLPGTVEMNVDLANADRGDVLVSTVDLADESGLWTGIYFQDIPVTLQATPDAGEHFLGWGDEDDTMDPVLVVLAASPQVDLAPQFGKAARWRVHELYTSADESFQYIELKTDYAANPTYAGAVLDCGNGITALLGRDLGTAGSTDQRSILIATSGQAPFPMPGPDFTLPAGCLDPAGGTITLDGVEIATYGAFPGGEGAMDDTGASVPPTPQNSFLPTELPAASPWATVMLAVLLAGAAVSRLRRR